MPAAAPACGLVGRALAARQHVESLDQGGEAHGGVDVALGHVEAHAVGDQRHADHQQEAERKHDDGRVLDLMVEVWDRAPGEASSFDGLWKLESREAENPQLTEFAETKMIGGGHFATLQSGVYQGEKARIFGFGIFELKQDGTVLETGMVGSWDDYQGVATEVKMELIDENRLQQTFTFDDRLITQTYIRM